MLSLPNLRMNLTLTRTGPACVSSTLGSTVLSGVLNSDRGLLTPSGDILVSMVGSGDSSLILGDPLGLFFNLNGDLLGTGGSS
jgi:hypothetical protein